MSILDNQAQYCKFEGKGVDLREDRTSLNRYSTKFRYDMVAGHAMWRDLGFVLT